MTDLINFAALTIFARECLEGSIIIGEYRTIILRHHPTTPTTPCCTCGGHSTSSSKTGGTGSKTSATGHPASQNENDAVIDDQVNASSSVQQIVQVRKEMNQDGDEQCYYCCNCEDNRVVEVSPGFSQSDALREVTLSAAVAAIVAIVVILSIAIPLAILSINFDKSTAYIIEGISKIVASISLLLLSLELPTFLGVYKRKKGNNKKHQQQPPSAVSVISTSSNKDPNGCDAIVDFAIASDASNENNVIAHGATTATSADGNDKNNGGDGVDFKLVEVQENKAKTTIVSADSDDDLDGNSKGSMYLDEDDDNNNNNKEMRQQNQASKVDGVDSDTVVLTRRNIRFNVSWNIWREIAECGVFLIPYFLSGTNTLKSIPLSAVIGSIVGLACGYGIYIANQKMVNKRTLAIFSVSLLVILSAGLFTGGCHKLEMELTSTRTVWTLPSDFWSVDSLPMTLLKPFGYNDSRTVLEIICYWGWLVLSSLFHYRAYRRTSLCNNDDDDDNDDSCSNKSMNNNSVAAGSANNIATAEEEEEDNNNEIVQGDIEAGENNNATNRLEKLKESR